MSGTFFDLIGLYEKKKQDAIKNYFESLSAVAFKKHLNRNVRDCPHNLATIVKAYFFGSPNDTEDGRNRQQFIYEAVFGLLQQTLPSQMGTDLIGILLVHIDELSAECLANLAMKNLDILKNASKACGRYLELLPMLIKTIAGKDEIPYRENMISGEEFKKHFLDDLCSVKWLPENATALATVFREIPMTLVELQFVVDKLLRLIKKIEPSEIPSFIYQLLLLSAKAKGLNQTVLQGIVSVFNVQNADVTILDNDDDLQETSHTAEEFRHVEGTVILHITYAMSQNQELASEFVKFLKANQHNPKNILVPFTIALGLAIIRFQSFKISVLDLFKSAIVKHFKELEMKKNSNWFREMMESHTDVTTVFLDVVKNSTFGWDYVIQGLVQLGFVLLETTTVKSVGRKPAENSNADANVAKNPIADLGSTILLSVFKASDIVRSPILEQILNHIFSKGNLANQCIRLLAQIVQTSPLFVLDSVSKIQQTISSLPMMPPHIAVDLIKAIFPLLRINMPLKESIILVLRKSLISGHLDSRKIAVKGYIHFLKNFKILGHLPASQSSQTSWSSSQICADVHTSLNPEMNEVLCCELLSTLACALNQQAEIRQIVYKGLYNVLYKNKKMTVPILQLLKGRLECFYQSNKNVQPPLKLDKVILIQNEKITLVEPLGTLLMCIQKCVIATNLYLNANEEDLNDLDKTQTCIALEEVLKSLSDRMASAELEDFELDKSADYNTSTSVGMKNNQLAVTILLIYEVLMEYLFCSEGVTATSTEKILNLHKNYKQLLSILKEDTTKKAEGKTAGRSVAFKTPPCLMTLECLASLINKLLLHNDDNIACLQGNEFVRHLITSAVQKIQDTKIEEFDTEDENQHFSVLCQLAKTLCEYYNEHVEEVATADKGKKTQPLHSLCLETFLLITTTIANKFTRRIVEFVNFLQGKTSFRRSQIQEESSSTKINGQIQVFQRYVDNILEQDEDNRSLKDVIIFINIISTFSSQISTDSEYLEQILTWVQTIITEHKFGDVNLVKCCLELFLTLSHQSKSKSTVLRDLAQDIHSRLGDIDEEVQVEESKHFAIVSEQMAPTIRQLLLQHFEQILTEVDWILNFSKSDLSSLQRIDMEDEDIALTQQENRDKKLCNHIGLFLTVMHELVQTAIPPGLSVDNLLKLLGHGYNTLNLFTKYYIAMYTLKVGKSCNRYEKLIKLTGTMLSPQVYALITYFQVLQNEEPSKDNKKKRKIDSTVQKSKILRETRQIPPLIYAIEQFETSLMLLSKKSKINFMQHVKLSTSRDFRINATVMMELDTNHSDREDESENVVKDATLDNNEPNVQDEHVTEMEVSAPKKLRLSRGRKPKSNN